jgi:hypothetical protein
VVFTQPLLSNVRPLWLHYSGFKAVFIQPFLSNVRPLWLHYSGFQAVFTQPLLSNVLSALAPLFRLSGGVYPTVA